jgi:hypothetical protein
MMSITTLLKDPRLVLATPFLLATYPIISLAAANNPAEVPQEEVALLLSVVGAGTLIMTGALLLGLRDAPRAAAIASLLALVFFAYGHVAQGINDWSLGSFEFGRQRFLLPGTVLTTLVLLVVVIRYGRGLRQLLIGIGAAVFLLTAFNSVQMMRGWSEGTSSSSALASATLHDASELPDIYWLLFDMYGREDVLHDMYDFDNSPFLDELESMGFFIADAARTNYVPTQNSIPATLSMNHIADLREEERANVTRGRGTNNWRLESSVIGATASALGYELHSMSSKDATVWGMSDFSAIFLDSTALLAVNTGPIRQWWARNWAPGFVRNIERVEDLTSISNPTFTFSYSLPPHPPFLYGRDGTIRGDVAVDFRPAAGFAASDSKDRYIDQLIFVNGVILETVRAIIDTSDEFPIIVVQTDHGPASNLPVGGSLDDEPSEQLLNEMMPILNAVLIPDKCSSALYPELSPVNTFRTIFDACLGTEFGRVSDASYFGETSFTEVR